MSQRRHDETLGENKS